MEGHHSAPQSGNRLTRSIRKWKRSRRETEVESGIKPHLHNHFEEGDCSRHERGIKSHVIDVPHPEGEACKKPTSKNHKRRHGTDPSIRQKQKRPRHQNKHKKHKRTSQVISDQFVKATREGKWSAMKEFLNPHTRKLTSPLFRDGGTALHHTLHLGKEREGIAKWLVENMSADDLDIGDDEGYTPLAIAALHHHPVWLLKLMIDKNSRLPNIGLVHTIPVAVACWKGFKDTARFLYGFTGKNILNPEYEKGLVGVYLLHHCINIKLFDIASEIVEIFTNNILLRPYTDKEVSIYPLHALAKTFSAFPSGGGNQKKPIFAYYNILKYVSCPPEENEEEDDPLNEEESDDIFEARKFLKLVCEYLSELECDIDELSKAVGEAMVEAAKHGNIEFITEMLKVNSELILAGKNGKNIFWHAVVNRQEKVFNLIYDVGDHKDSLLSHVNKKGNNILHCAAKLPRSSVLGRISSPALQMQRELQWFKEVSNVAKTRYRGDVNEFKLTPRQLFTKQHSGLVDAAETSMKDTAKAATTVGGFMITTVFASAFTVTVGNNKNKTNSSFVSNEMMLDIFVVCDSLSLCLSTCAILVFLGILTSRYSEQDFLHRLPRRFMTGFCTFFVALAAMMVSFCCALAITLEGRSLLMVSVVCVLVFFPIKVGLSSICPLLRETRNSTNGPSIFDKNTKLPKSRRAPIESCH